ncbi:MAG: cytochrome c [Nitrospinae bacterium]|nr:cytochrome c [Nitrospinota bacterium]
MGTWKRVCAPAFVVLAAVVFLPSFSAGQDEQTLRGVQRVRVRTMKSISRAMRRVKVYTKKANYERVAAAAEEIALLSAAIPYLSPKGSAFGKTRIKAEVWSRFDDYSKIARDSAQIARDVAKAAQAKDKSAVLKTFSALSDSCTQCHKPYRKKKRK